MQPSRSIVRNVSYKGGVQRLAISQQYVCASCRRQLIKRAHSAPFSAQSNKAKEKLPLTEKIRRKIWGTDNPPGYKDPYDKNSGLNAPSSSESHSETAPSASSELIPTKSINDTFKFGAKETATAGFASKLAEEYKPATSWEGLEEVGFSPQELDLQKDLQVPYFPRSSTLEDPELVARAFAVVLEELLPSVLNFGLPSISSIDINSPAPSKDHRKELLNKGWSVVRDGQKWILRKESNDETIQLDNLINNDKLKFEMVKGLVKRTGRSLQDPVITKASTIEDLYQAYLVKNPPKKIAEQLQSRSSLSQLSNITISERRITPIDKDTDIGRWKVIEKELQARGLPVTGHSEF